MQIIEINSSSLFKKFLNFPLELYKELGNDKFVMPLKLITKISIGNYKKNKKIKLFLAMEQDKVIARIGTKLQTEKGKSKVHFGFFECRPERQDVVDQLFEHIKSIYPDTELIGPYNFRMEDPYVGLMIEGSNTDPYFMMTYNPQYYQGYLENAGFKGVMDLLTYDVDGTKSLPAEMGEKAKELENQNYSIRAMTPKSMKKDVRIISAIFNDALSENWGYEEISKEQINDMYLMFKFFINPDIVIFALDENKKEVGCLIMLPNFNKYIKDTKGSLTPKLIWNVLTKRKKLDSARGYALGIKKGMHGKGIGNFLVWHGWERSSKQAGIKKGEISWILADNDRMNNLTVKMDGKPNRKYRIYSSVTN